MSDGELSEIRLSVKTTRMECLSGTRDQGMFCFIQWKIAEYPFWCQHARSQGEVARTAETEQS